MSGFSVKNKNFMTYKIGKKKYIPLHKKPLLRIIQILKMIRLTIIVKAVHENCNIEELVDFSLAPRNNILQLQQYKSEIISLLKNIRELQPKIILEIGTLNGGTLFLFSRVISKNTLLISLDLPKARLGRFQIDWRFFFIKKFSLPHQRMILLRADSHRSSTLNQIKKILDGHKLDFLFIDADHSYEGVKKDFEMYGSLVKTGDYRIP